MNSGSESRTQSSWATARLVFWGILALGLLVRIVVAYFFLGSTDVKRWLFFSGLIEQGAYRELYFSGNPLWNHPAPVILFMKLVAWLHNFVGLPFHFALKLLPVFADMGVSALIYHMGSRRFGTTAALWLMASYVASPAAIAISGYHGNTDCIMMLFILFTVMAFGKRASLAGLFFGLAISTKYTPLLLLPLFALRCRSFGTALKFVVLSSLPVILFSAVFVHSFPERAIANIVTYGSTPGAWGLGHVRALLESGWLGAPGKGVMLSITDLLLAWSKPLIVVGACSLAVLARFRPNVSLLETVALTMGLFFALTPGFGVQYTVWLLPLFILAAPALGTVFNVAMSHFVVNAFMNGQVNDMDMINPEVRVTAFSVVGWVAVVAFVIRGFQSLIKPGATQPP